MRSLVQIYEEQGDSTDKITAHKYGYLYEELFYPIRDTVTSVLEIGVAQGGSVRAWRDYFPNATIYAVDKSFAAIQYIEDEDRIVPIHSDIKDFLMTAPLDIVIDDGSHLWQDIGSAFSLLWPLLNPGGYYIIEDVAQSPDIWSVLSTFGTKSRLTLENGSEAARFSSGRT